MNNLNITQIVAGLVAAAFGIATAVVFIILAIRGTLSPEFLGAIIGGVVVGVFHAVGIAVGSITASNSSAQGASQALSTPPQVTTTPTQTNI